jgi:hypothetical protein
MRPWSSAWILLHSVTQKDTWEIGWCIEPYTLCRYATGRRRQKQRMKCVFFLSKFKSCGMLHCVVWEIFPDVSSDRAPFSWSKIPDRVSLTLRMRAPQFFETSEIIYQEKWRHIPEDFTLQKYRCDNMKFWIVFVIELIFGIQYIFCV